ncbi:hypothetical protein [Aliagarivorans marinus]|uniref:hypothetical protein n=1 Tax=Aliagarivorans marinus TaxID=561965 RepID=UPI00047AADE3|nr:hypothetical protein [Aliagarivorans marinus]
MPQDFSEEATQASTKSITNPSSDGANTLMNDKPQEWRYIVTAELMRAQQTPLYERLDKLSQQTPVVSSAPMSEEDTIHWIRNTQAELKDATKPFSSQIENLNTILTKQHGSPEPLEIERAVTQISNQLEKCVALKESLGCLNLPEECERFKDEVQTYLAIQLVRLRVIPEKLDNIAAELGHNDTNEGNVATGLGSMEIPFEWQSTLSEQAKITVLALNKNHLDRDSQRARSKVFRAFIAIIVILSIIWLVR